MVIALLILIAFLIPTVAWADSPEPFLVATSNIIPGVGHAWLGMQKETITDATSTIAPFLLGLGAFVFVDDLDDDEDDFETQRASAISFPLLITSQDIWFYGIFHAYQDALRKGGEAYPQGSLSELYRKPFSLNYLKSPWVSLGVLAWVGSGIGIMSLMDEAKGKNLFRYERVRILGKHGKPWQGVIAHAGYYGALFSSVAVGEEALFRGMLQTEIKRATGSSNMALIGQSLIFGAAHTFEPELTAQESLVRFAWTGLLGAYMGWLYQQNSYNLGSSITFHYWYDTLISLVDYILNPQSGALCFQINFVRKSW